MTDGEPTPRRRAWIGWTIAGVVTLMLVAGGWVIVRGIGAVTSLTSAAQTARTLQDRVLSNELDDVDTLSSRLAADARNARSLTGDPVWRAAELVPWVGTNLRAVRQVSEIADDISSDAISPFLEAARGADLGTLGISGGHVDLAPLVAIAPELAKAATVLGAAQDSARDIDAAGTLPPLADAIGTMTDAIDKAGRAAGALSGAAQLLPTMLGGSEPRTYLLLMQNNAELRSSGGIPGAMAIITAVNGTVTLGTQADTTDFHKAASPVMKLPQPIVDLFDQNPALRIQDTVSAPDFPTAGALAAQMWQRTMGGQVDGVIAMDAIVVKYILGATGPVNVEGTELDGDNAAETLLGDIYKRLPDPNAQDDFFAGTATALFSAATSGNVDVHALLGALSRAGEDGRIRVWSTHDDEQKKIKGTTLSGIMPADTARDTHVGVLVNDTTGGKMDYYADAAVAVREGACGPDGRSVVRVEVTWSSSAPADAATSLPAYVTGSGWWGVPVGITGTRIAVIGPEGWKIVDYSGNGDGEVIDPRETQDGDRAIVQQELRTAPGGTQTVTVEFVSPERDAAPTLTSVTPMIRNTPVTVTALSCG